ncbi:MAG: TonB family protein [Chloroflexi bacterium]|nr:TonB family protein [Chloroflexota bacterium]
MSPATLCVLAFALSTTTPAMILPEGLKSVPLCRALESIEQGDQIPVVVSGIYAVDFLYDPEEPVCQLTVQPNTCVEFSPTLDRPPEFNALHKEYLRVYVTFRGILYGAQAVPEIRDTSLPLGARLAAANNAGYCANNIDRTKLVVEAIISFSPVPREVPWHPISYEKDFPQDRPFPIAMALPKYPPAARALDAQGIVIVGVTVSAGEVTRAEVQYGDPVLIEEALANVRTWRFSPEVNTSFSVDYEFRFEKRPMNEGRNPALEMRLPYFVKVIVPTNDW